MRRSGKETYTLTAEEYAEYRQRLAEYPGLEGAADMVAEADIFRAARGTTLVGEGEPLEAMYFLLEGIGRVYNKTDVGREFTQAILEAPSHFGDVDQLAGRETSSRALVLIEDAVVARVPWEAFEDVLRRDHQSALRWMAKLAESYAHTIDVGRHALLGTLPDRISNLLLSYAEVRGNETSDGVELESMLSRSQVARQVGSVKRVVSRVLQDLEKRGLISSHNGKITIKQLEALEADVAVRKSLVLR